MSCRGWRRRSATKRSRWGIPVNRRLLCDSRCRHATSNSTARSLDLPNTTLTTHTTRNSPRYRCRYRRLLDSSCLRTHPHARTPTRPHTPATPTQHGLVQSRTAARGRRPHGASADYSRRSRWHMEQQVQLDHDRQCTHSALCQAPPGYLRRQLTRAGLLRSRQRPLHRAQAHRNQLLLHPRRLFRGGLLPRRRQPYVPAHIPPLGPAPC
jgi:hypothetical protein